MKVIRLANARDNLVIDSVERAAMDALVTFFGDFGVDNNVHMLVTQDPGIEADAGTTLARVTTVRINMDEMTSPNSNSAQVAAFVGSSAEVEITGVLAHEGTHGLQQRSHGMP